MPREPKGLQQTTMTSWHKLTCFVILMLCVSTAKLYAQTKGESPCFTIHVSLNGKPIAEPRSITFKTKEWEKTASVEAGCFKVPPAVLAEKDVDVLFTVPRNRVYLSTIPSGFLVGPWDVQLEDKRFGSDVALPKHARTKEVCAVVFHVGEPETTRTLTGCRTKF
jgi:hypothetical protein